MSVKAIPSGYHSITPYLSVNGASDAIDYYKHAFGAEELFRMPMPDGKLGHAEIKIGDSVIMLADGCSTTSNKDPKTLGGTPVSILLYVEGVDQVFARAIAAGATVRDAISDKFYGDRSGTLIDPFGHIWTIATHKEDVSQEEMNRRMEELMKNKK